MEIIDREDPEVEGMANPPEEDKMWVRLAEHTLLMGNNLHVLLENALHALDVEEVEEGNEADEEDWETTREDACQGTSSLLNQET
ncbi:hypothetical protein DACRYDRAFT_111342 [Dacryopinax primogenitus]|uniref:Uncharacterized protein n=1 Tax=Dacryopinax primogenitus (strain DJM 731) TaxID=1858805 RepID=M5FRX3_DACPD|nr:uncharacterized protein DACRYDRAFT_111342 [Dacryopinax primogenitus]EJT97824.1 hypothetical protein DACRYDRAFT_111342 [Dacryopinax primogenitus]